MVGFKMTFDCADPVRLGEFWADALGYVEQPPPEGYPSWNARLAELGLPADERDARYVIVDPEGAGPRIFFQGVPEPKTAKNRIHLDVYVGGPAEARGDQRRRRVLATVERLTAIGAERVRDVEEYGEFWVVMRDPEGNEFCLM